MSKKIVRPFFFLFLVLFYFILFFFLVKLSFVVFFLRLLLTGRPKFGYKVQ